MVEMKQDEWRGKGNKVKIKGWFIVYILIMKGERD